MFTGIVEATGTVAALERREGGVRLTVATDLDVGALPLGASIAVDGVCLTVVERAAGRFAADLGPETLARTTLGALRPGERVHLERPLRLGDALGGHLVSGHVDGVGTVVGRRQAGTSLELEIAAPATVVATLVPKGSITVGGASLTINGVTDERFSVTLIPHTLAVTALGALAIGAAVNLEGDLIAKHVDRLVTARLERDAEASARDAAGRDAAERKRANVR
ncbi:MAG TPA: riboflavin synthase [Polyangia bacterium]|jgi:riboflavin synthase